MPMNNSDDKVVTVRLDRAGVQTKFICKKPLSASDELIGIVRSIPCIICSMGFGVFRGSDAQSLKAMTSSRSSLAMPNLQQSSTNNFSP